MKQLMLLKYESLDQLNIHNKLLYALRRISVALTVIIALKACLCK